MSVLHRSMAAGLITLTLTTTPLVGNPAMANSNDAFWGGIAVGTIGGVVLFMACVPIRTPMAIRMDTAIPMPMATAMARPIIAIPIDPTIAPIRSTDPNTAPITISPTVAAMSSGDATAGERPTG